MADLNLIYMTASPPPPGILIPTGSELMLAGLPGGMGAALGWHRSRARALRYAGVVVVLTAAYYAVIPEHSALQGALDRTIIPAFSWAPALLLSALGTPATVDGTRIVSAEGSWEVLRGCLGWTYLAIFTFGVAALPVSPRRRILGIAAGLFIHMTLNCVRIVTLCLLWLGGAHAAYEILHAAGGVCFAVVLLAVWWAVARVGFAGVPSRAFSPNPPTPALGGCNAAS